MTDEIMKVRPDAEQRLRTARRQRERQLQDLIRCLDDAGELLQDADDGEEAASLTAAELARVQRAVRDAASYLAGYLEQIKKDAAETAELAAYNARRSAGGTR